MKEIRASWFPVLLAVLFLGAFLRQALSHSSPEPLPVEPDNSWHAPDINLLPDTDEGDLIRYGRELIVNTSMYLGPHGRIASLTNGMNCQNCHVRAGTKPFGSSFALVAASYPQYRNRSGRVESIEFRINDCMERSLNGKGMDSLSREMRAMVAYLKWIGQGITKENKPVGSGMIDIPFINRAADPQKGRLIFENNCQRCHGSNGEGQLLPDSTGYKYPPLWGANSYNSSAGLYRISRLAAFIKYNMPFDNASLPLLSDEEAWDVAAFISSQPRPEKRFEFDWPKIETKPVDHPFGPYADGFSELQHKYGPFQPIREANEKAKANK